MTIETITPALQTGAAAAAEPDASDEDRRMRLLAAQARRITVLQEEIRTRQDELDGLKTQILDQWAPGSYEADGLDVQVREGRRSVNANRFQKAFPAKAYPECYQLKPLPLSKLEKVLTERAMRPFTSIAKPTVVVA